MLMSMSLMKKMLMPERVHDAHADDDGDACAVKASERDVVRQF